MKCIFCNAKTVEKNIEHKEFGVSLGHFNANVCGKCGEVFFDEKTAQNIQEKSKELGLFGLARKAKIAEVGNSLAIRIPKEIAIFLDFKKGNEVLLVPRTKHDLHIEV